MGKKLLMVVGVLLALLGIAGLLGYGLLGETTLYAVLELVVGAVLFWLSRKGGSSSMPTQTV